MSDISETPPHFDNWQEAWEWHAERAARVLDAQPVEALLAQIETGQYDVYYSIWYILRQKATLAQAAPALLAVLRREAGEPMMLIRYHCAAALFHLMGSRDDPIPKLRQRVQWDHAGEPARQAAIDELEAQINRRLAGLAQAGD